MGCRRRSSSTYAVAVLGMVLEDADGDGDEAAAVSSDAGGRVESENCRTEEVDWKF